MRAIQLTAFGGPEVLTLADVPDPVAGADTEILEVLAAGVNYGDTHQTENSYLARPRLPWIPGAEVVGRRADGSRVVALLPASGGYAERVAAPAALSFPVPDDVDDLTALALVVQGTTAWHLLRTSAQLRPGESVVVHAAAGGVGSLAVQLARRFGAGRVIATASTEQKRALAAALGADVVLDVTVAEGDPQALTDALVEANGGRPVDVVLEMVGGDVFAASLEALAPFGRLVTYGMASRTMPTPVAAEALMGTSRAVVGFWLAHCLRRPAMLTDALGELLALARAGELRPLDGGRYPLSAARRAHEDLRARRTTGKLVLDPSA